MTWTLVVTLIIQSNMNNRGQVKCKRMVFVAAECSTSLIETRRDECRLWFQLLDSSPLLHLSVACASVPWVDPQGYERIVVMKS